MRASGRPDPCFARDHHPVAHAIAWAFPALLLGFVIWDASPALRLWLTGPPAPFCAPGPGSRAFRSFEGTRTRYLALCADGTYGVIAREHVFVAILERGAWEPASGEEIRFRVRRGGALGPPEAVELRWPEEIGLARFEAEWRRPQAFLFHPGRNGRSAPVLDHSGS